MDTRVQCRDSPQDVANCNSRVRAQLCIHLRRMRYENNAISFDGFATLEQFPTLYLMHDNSTEFAGHRPETGLGEGHKDHKARNHGAADEKPTIWPRRSSACGRSDGNLLSNIMKGRRIRHFGCKRDVGSRHACEVRR